MFVFLNIRMLLIVWPTVQLYYIFNIKQRKVANPHISENTAIKPYKLSKCCILYQLVKLLI